MALVVLGIVDTWIFAIMRSVGKDPAKGVMSFQVLRLVRLLRVLRVIRIVRFLRELLFLVKGIIVSLKALVPSLVLILLFLYMSALFIHRVLGRRASETQDPELEADMDKWFGTVGRTLFTLFQIMTLDAWPIIVRTSMKEFHPSIWLFFVPFLVITHYTLLNLVTAVVVENVLVISQQEQTKEAQQNEQQRFENIRKLKQLLRTWTKTAMGSSVLTSSKRQ
jgi:voltage-gated sodium channel